MAALGYTLQLPVAEGFLSTRDELRDQLAMLLQAGRSRKSSRSAISPAEPPMTWSRPARLPAIWSRA
ncbi:MAG: hypothetical protein MZW92_34495 [Comamonadaceae bacterium]|nr:hypothetical protein [Comamonadaceae bacterium]